MTGSSNAPPSNWKQMNLSGFVGMIGPLWAQRQNDQWRYGFQTGSEHANLAGIIHGGMLSSLADQAMSLAAWEAAERTPAVTIQMDLKFMAAVKPGDFLEAIPLVRQRTKSLLFIEAVLEVSGDQIAFASGVWKLLPKKT